jgi:disulfide bond formation protein DsbB
VRETDAAIATQSAWVFAFAAFLLVMAATAASLFFSNVMKVPVCELCWYQRIALYPLIVIIGIGLFRWSPDMLRTAGTLTAIGWLISAFHLLLIAGLIPENARPCVQGIPCSETYFSVFGVLNIPTLSLLTFSLVGVLLYLAHRKQSS